MWLLHPYNSASNINIAFRYIFIYCNLYLYFYFYLVLLFSFCIIFCVFNLSFIFIYFFYFWIPDSVRRSYEFSSVHLCISPSIQLSICSFSHLKYHFLRIGSLLFSDILHEVRLQQIHKKNRTYFSRKFLLSPTWVTWDIFRPKINIFKLFSKFLHHIFLKLYLMEGI